MRRWWRNEDGVTSIEYAMIASLIAVGIVAGVTLTRTNLLSLFAQVSASFPSR